jgi:hypothetical protein
MRLRIMAATLLIAAVEVAAVNAGEARLACPKPGKGDETAESLASALFDQGEAAFKKRRYNKALNRFVCSLRLSGHINTVYNIAQVIPYIKRKKRALSLLRGHVEAQDDSWTIKELKKIIIRLEQDLKLSPSWDPASVLH